MRKVCTIWLILGLYLLSAANVVHAGVTGGQLSFEFFGDTVRVPLDASMEHPFPDQLDEKNVRSFYAEMEASHYGPTMAALLDYRESHALNDWFYYQLIRRTAQQVAPKMSNYYRYTLYKWFFLTKSGYDATLSIHEDVLLFSVYSQDEVYGIPFYVRNGKQYVCLNIHDYARAGVSEEEMKAVDIVVAGADKAFSYKVTRLPELKASDYAQKNLRFDYGDETYYFHIKLNPGIKQVFTNYPALDFASYFNIPMSRETYESLVPMLRNNIKHMKQRKGVDYLMNFTRYAFVYEDDERVFGKEKRMSPEETLSYDQSDCDDRAALFFYLVKEIYNLPMIAVQFPTHVTIAVQFDKPVGQTVSYNGREYSICEPTPQGSTALAIGEVAPQWRNSPYQVVFVYNPAR